MGKDIVPIDRDKYSRFIEESRIFDKAKVLLIECLSNWYSESSDAFVEDMRADFNSVINSYHFHNETVAISKHFDYDPVLDYISCTIRITDEEDDWCIRYKVIFDYDLNAIDDSICT